MEIAAADRSDRDGEKVRRREGHGSPDENDARGRR
jgi:hypothetical protein